MYRYLVPLILGAALALASACAGTTYTASATLRTPDLVFVQPGVYAVANYAEPVFYANNFYWRYDRGAWFRSPRFTGGWQFVRQPPPVIRRIDRPTARYVRRGGRVFIEERDRPRARSRVQVLERR